MNDHLDQIGSVVIGRNEGDRLKRCLQSFPTAPHHLVYVDSGSTDGSVQFAISLGVDVVDLDLSTPFTAARARNAGIDRLLEGASTPRYVQFTDGDCELHPDWLSTAYAYLEEHPDVAVVCGRRRERFPDATVYNRMIDREWDTPIGEARSCGGDALFRADALRNANGYDPNFIAGEEPELCVRLRSAGWKVMRIDAEMTMHDAAMTKITQWWQRAKRAGFAYSAGATKHGSPPERHNVPERNRAILWGIGVPCAAILGCLLSPATLAILLLWPLQFGRLILKGHTPTDAFFLVVGKIPEALGVIKHTLSRLSGRNNKLIEYK